MVKKGIYSLNAAREDKEKYAAMKKAFNTCDDIAGPDQVD